MPVESVVESGAVVPPSGRRGHSPTEEMQTTQKALFFKLFTLNYWFIDVFTSVV